MSGEIEMIQSDGNIKNGKFDPDVYLTVNIPSAKRIPDEYIHNDNKLGLVIIFHSVHDVENAGTMQRNLLSQEYDIPDKNVVPLTTKKSVLNCINNIAIDDHSDKTCLILIMMGNSEYEGEILPDDEHNSNVGAIKIKEVFTPFAGNRCASFRNKPKIFIFQSSIPITSVQADCITRFTPVAPTNANQVPTEADILLVCKHITDASNRHLFIDDLCNNIQDVGQMDDIIGLVTHTNHDDDKRPLVISTLTKKFYMSSSKERSHYYDFYKTQENMLQISQNLASKVNKCRLLIKSQDTTNNHCKSPILDAVNGAEGSRKRSVAPTSSTTKGTKKKIAKKNNKRPPWK